MLFGTHSIRIAQALLGAHFKRIIFFVSTKPFPEPVEVSPACSL